jgi:ATP-dependent DNA ligase
MFPPVVSVNSHGKKTEWRIVVRLFRDDEHVKGKEVLEESFIEIADEYFDNKPMHDTIRGWLKVFSKTGENGKIRDVVPTIVKEGKNAGRANATNVFCQSLRDALSLHNKQLKKVKGEQIVGETTRYPPLLAQVFKDQTGFENFPTDIEAIPITKEVRDFLDQPLPERMFLQKKYNGVRTVATLDKDDHGNEIAIMYSRQKHLYPGFPYVNTELLPVLKYYWEEGRHLYLDGEIYKHGELLQQISGDARREYTEGKAKYNYMVYDLFIANEPDLKYSERMELLDEIFENFEDHLVYTKRVDTVEPKTFEDIRKEYVKYVRDEKFEGAMVRRDFPYRYSYNGYHSNVLLKIKPTYDDEFEVVGWETGEKGKAAEALMIVCQTKEGKRFPVTPARELPDRIALAKKMNDIEENGKTHFENEWNHKYVKVYFDELSKDKVPQRARTLLERMGIEIIQ